MANSTQIPSMVSDYHVLPISLPPLPSFPTPATHYLYLKPDTPDIPTPTSSRSLFLVNVPIDATEPHFKHLFSTQLSLPAGRVQSISFESDPAPSAIASSDQSSQSSAPTSKRNRKRKRETVTETLPELKDTTPSTWDRKLQRSGSTAVVVFVDRASMEVALKAVRHTIRKGSPKIVWGEGLEASLPPLGPERYATHQALQYPPRSALLSAINDYMTAFNAQTEAKAKARTRTQEPDEEGFVTVTKKGSVKQEEAKERLEKEKAKKKELVDFYRFQGREKRKEREGELRKRFEEDAERVRKMRERRGTFKPE